MRSIYALVAVILAACASPAGGRPISAAPACTTSLPVTAELVAEAGRFGWIGIAARGGAPDMLIGSLWYLRDNMDIAEGLSGSVVFVRDGDGGWRAIVPSPEQSIVAAYVAPSTGALVFAAMTQTEGPGQSWTLVQTPDAFATAACSEIAFPSDLNQPHWANEYLHLHDFDIAADGRGELIGVADVERNGAATTLAYLFTTSDAGASWSAPSPIAGARPAREALYEQMLQTDEADRASPLLVNALTTFAQQR